MAIRPITSANHYRWRERDLDVRAPCFEWAVAHEFRLHPTIGENAVVAIPTAQ